MSDLRAGVTKVPTKRIEIERVLAMIRKLSILFAEDSYQPKTKSKAQVQATKFNQKGPVQYSTAQYSPLGPDTAQHSPVQYSLVQHSEVQYSFVKSSTAHYSLVKPSCSPIQPVIFLNIVLLVALSSLTELKPISF